MPTTTVDKFSDVLAECNMAAANKASKSTSSSGPSLPDGDYTAILKDGEVDTYEQDGLDGKFPRLRLHFELEGTPGDDSLAGRRLTVWFRLGPNPKAENRCPDAGRLKQLYEKLFDQDVPQTTDAEGEEVDDLHQIFTDIFENGMESRWALRLKTKGDYQNTYVNDLLAEE